MALALLISASVAYAVGYAMFKNRRVESISLAILDILQSVPILGFFPVVLYAFTNIPLVGLEAAAVFLIFTSMAWNMIFGVYQSFKTIPGDYFAMSQIYLKSLEDAHLLVPAALRSLVYNATVSWGNAFFFITSSEVITLGSEVKLFGIGSLVVEAFEKNDYLTAYVGITLGILGNMAVYSIFRRLSNVVDIPPRLSSYVATWMRWGRYVVLSISATILLLFLTNLSVPALPPGKFLEAASASMFSTWRVLAVLAIGLAVGVTAAAVVTEKPSREGAVFYGTAFLSSIPPAFLYPLLAMFISGEALAVALLASGSVVYIVMNTVAAWRDIPRDFTKAYNISGGLYLIHVLLPSTLPYLTTGLLTAWGGAWNATIAAEPLAGVWGIGAYMAKATDRGDLEGVSTALVVMVGIVLAVNRLLWKRLYRWASQWV